MRDGIDTILGAVAGFVIDLVVAVTFSIFFTWSQHG